MRGVASQNPRRTVLREFAGGSLVRLVGLPAVLALGLLNTSIVLTHTGREFYGLVNTVGTIGALLPFADLGIGGTLTTAVALSTADPGPGRRDLGSKLAAGALVLCAVSVALIALALVVGFTHGWSLLLGQPLSDLDDWIISVCVCLFALGVPLGLGPRVLIGLGRNDVAVGLIMTAPLFGLACTGLIAVAGGLPLAYAASTFVGTVLSEAVCCVVAARHLRRRGYLGLGREIVQGWRHPRRLPYSSLSGSGALLIVTIGLPAGLETGRLIVAHASSAGELSQFALMAQLYGIAWSVVGTASGGMWTYFAKNRHDAGGSVQLWRRAVLAFGVVGLVGAFLLAAAAPWVAAVLSHGSVTVPFALAIAFGALLLAQALHLPGGSLLTTPAQLRWQAASVVAMAGISLVLALVLVGPLGGLGVAAGAALGVLVAQFGADLVLVPRLIRRDRRTALPA